MENKNNLVKDLLYYKFYEGLKEKYNISKEQFNQYNFKYCGKFKPDIDEETKQLILPNDNQELFPLYNYGIDSYFFIFFSYKEIIKLKPMILYKSRCICDIKIKKNYFIYSRSQDIFLIIGSCCNKRFNENGNKKFCLM
jgi:hypothetical protein